MNTPLYIGLMSGTSMDGVDCALLDFSSTQPRVVDYLSEPLPATLKTRLLRLSTNAQIDLRELGTLDIEVAQQFAYTVHKLLARNALQAATIAAIGSHGQTVWHEPPQAARHQPFTLQIGDPNTLAESTGITVVADLRRRDMAAGGQGAPIVPALHRELFHSRAHNRIVLNLGGIANITYLPRDNQQPCGLDTGPANVLMDAWIKQQRQREFDANGDWARSGQVHEPLLARLLDEAYFTLPAPKSTGRELFNLPWLQAKLAGLDPAPSAVDVQATLLALTVASVSREVLRLLPAGELIVCGGGARNAALVEQLGHSLPAFRILQAAECGFDADCVEAVAFAWLAMKALQREPVDFSPFTGARHPVLAGGIYYAD